VTYQLSLQIRMMLILSSFKVTLKLKTSNIFRETLRWVTKRKQVNLGQKYLLKNKRKIIEPILISLKQNSDKLQLRMIGFY
jgi:hypothetical protein